MGGGGTNVTLYFVLDIQLDEILVAATLSRDGLSGEGRGELKRSVVICV